MNQDIEEYIKKRYLSQGTFDSDTYLLFEILTTLREMKEQEKQYWETWRQSKGYRGKLE